METKTVLKWAGIALLIVFALIGGLSLATGVSAAMADWRFLRFAREQNERAAQQQQQQRQLPTKPTPPPSEPPAPQ